MLSDLEYHEITLFAQKQNLSIEAAIALPSIFRKVAETANKPLRVVIKWAMYSNQELADYIIKLAKEVVENMGDEMDELIAQGSK